MLKQKKEKPPASFLQITEKDDYDDDDAVAKLSQDGPTSDNAHSDNISHEIHHSSDELHFGIITDNNVLNNDRSEENSLDPNTDELSVLDNPSNNNYKFMQIKETITKKPKKRTIMDIAYSKPKKYKADDLDKVNIYRQNQMNDLQKNHQWTPSLREGINVKFNKDVASRQKKNADSFVSFLGYLRDASHFASFNINKLEVEKYFK